MLCFPYKHIIAHKIVTVNTKITNLYTFVLLYNLEVTKMCTLYKIIELLDNKGLKQKDLTDFLGLSKNAFTNWKNGNNNSYMKHLPKIAEFLGVSVDYLVGNENQREDQSDNEKLSFALFGTADVDEEVLNDVRKYAQIARRMREEDKKKED